MLAEPIPFRVMAKAKKEDVAPAPDPEVRLTAKLKRSERFRLRRIALELGENLEKMAARVLNEWAEARERKPPK
jgi:hypothetical protein